MVAQRGFRDSKVAHPFNGSLVSTSTLRTIQMRMVLRRLRASVLPNVHAASAATRNVPLTD
jgi:hypothetical protein